MFADIDLRKLSETTAPDRAFLSVYLAGPRSVAQLEKRFRELRRLLKGGKAEKDEREHFDENAKSLWKYLKHNPLESGSLCIISCWVLDVFQAIPLTAPVKDLVWIDSSPYIRPLAEIQDEYENVAVVVADDRAARIFCVSSAAAGDEERIRGNVKNHVKKGGWSQQRYERRRDKQLLTYAREIVDALKKLDTEENFRRLVLVGGNETLRVIHDNLPRSLAARSTEKAVDLSKGDDHVNEELEQAFTEAERQSERDLWERIRTNLLQDGLAVAGLHDVLKAAREGRVEKMVVVTNFTPEGRRCRDCGNLDVGAVAACSACSSCSLFRVAVVEEVIEMLRMTGADTDFVDPIDTLAEAGHIAALVRYQP